MPSAGSSPAPTTMRDCCIRTLWHSPGEVIGPVLAHIDDVDTIDVAELISFRVTKGLEIVDAELFRRHVPA